MPIPSISFRLAIVAMLVVLGVWFGWLTQFQQDVLIMHFAGSTMAKLIFVPLPVAVLAAFVGWNKGYFKKTYAIVAGLWLMLEFYNYVAGNEPKHPRIDLESTIMSLMIIVSVWFAYELFWYVKQYRAAK